MAQSIAKLVHSFQKAVDKENPHLIVDQPITGPQHPRHFKRFRVFNLIAPCSKYDFWIPEKKYTQDSELLMIKISKIFGWKIFKILMFFEIFEISIFGIPKIFFVEKKRKNIFVEKKSQNIFEKKNPKSF